VLRVGLIVTLPIFAAPAAAGTAACEDGDCTNEVITLSDTLQRFGGGLKGTNPGPNPKLGDFPLDSGTVGPGVLPLPNGLSTFVSPPPTMSGQLYFLPKRVFLK